MQDMSHVIVMGGGVIGLSVAYFLQKEGVHVTLYDQADLGRESSWAGAGMLPSHRPKAHMSPLDQLRSLASEAMADLSERLRDETGIDNGYLRCGGLELRCHESTLDRKRHEQRAPEMTGQGPFGRILDQAELQLLEPRLSTQLPGAIHFPDVAQVRNPRHLKALIAACMRLGVAIRPFCAIHTMKCHGHRITGVATDDGVVQADAFVITAGAWSQRFFESFGMPRVVQPVRGQIALLRNPNPLFSNVLMAGPEYLVPRPDGRVLVGSTEEHAGFDKRTTAAAIHKLLAMAIQFVPDLANAEIERCWAGLRPASIDKKPILGKFPETDNLYVATGHFRSGLHLSAITGTLLRDLMLDRPMALDLSPFGLDRFCNQAAAATWNP